MDGRLHAFLSPAHFVILSGWFNIFTPDLVTARLFSAFAGVLTYMVVTAIARMGALRRPHLVGLLFGFGSFALLIQRVALLEAHQMFWLTLAAYFWLRRGKRDVLFAGAAMGVALLVKSNSLYLVPAFALTVPRTRNSPDWRALAGFVATCLLVAGAGYAAAWAMNPNAFVMAFTYELDGRHFLDQGVVFHVGRFGLHPARAISAVQSFIRIDPLVLVLAATGMGISLRHWRGSSLVQRFATLWILLAVFFHFGQIYVEVRYLSTMAPSLALLSAVPIERLWETTVPSTRWSLKRWSAVGLVGMVCVYALLRIGLRTREEPNRAYWATVDWIQAHVPTETVIMSAPYIGLSLPQRSYDYFRLKNPYAGGERPFVEIVDSINARVFVADPEWRHFATTDIKQFTAQRTSVLYAADGIEVLGLRRE